MLKIPKVIVIFDTSTASNRRILSGIAKYTHIHGPWVFYRETPLYLRPFKRKIASSRMIDWGADGIIANISDTKETRELVSSASPAIIFSRFKKEFPDLPHIITHNFAIGKMAAEYLLNRGLRHFAFCGFNYAYWSQERGEGFCERIVQAGFESNCYKPRLKSPRSWEKEQPFLVDWLLSLPKPVGVMTCNDDRGCDVIEACKIADLRIPEEVAILGVDNDELVCDLSFNPLSSINLNTEKAGYDAAELLDRLMAGEKMAKQVIAIEPTHVVSRQTTDILAVDDSDVVDAIRFIQQHSKEPIQVNDVVNAVALSRRVLEKRFRRILGRSVLDEIRRVRIDKVAQMLLETNKSILQIALALGYSGSDNVARYFRKEKGMSPIAYRKRYGHR